jgi:hypothetical protein
LHGKLRRDHAQLNRPDHRVERLAVTLLDDRLGDEVPDFAGDPARKLDGSNAWIWRTPETPARSASQNEAGVDPIEMTMPCPVMTARRRELVIISAITRCSPVVFSPTAQRSIRKPQ